MSHPIKSKLKKFNEGLFTKFRQISGSQYDMSDHPGSSNSKKSFQSLGLNGQRLETKNKGPRSREERILKKLSDVLQSFPPMRCLHIWMYGKKATNPQGKRLYPSREQLLKD